MAVLGQHVRRFFVVSQRPREVTTNFYTGVVAPPDLTRQPVHALAYDLETTSFGLDAEIVDFAVVHATSSAEDIAVNTLRPHFQSYVLPKQGVHWGARQVHGLSKTCLVERGAKPFPVVLDHLQEWLRTAIPSDTPIVWTAHNGSTFDHRILRSSMEAVGFEIPSHWVFWDTLPLARRLRATSHAASSGNSLRQLLRECSEGLLVQESQHSALEDAQALAFVWQWLALQDSVTYGALADSFQTYLQWIVHKEPIDAPQKRLRSSTEVTASKITLLDRADPVAALPGIGAHSASCLHGAGVETVADLQLKFEQLGKNKKNMIAWLKGVVPRAHPIGLNQSVRWLAIRDVLERDDLPSVVETPTRHQD